MDLNLPKLHGRDVLCLIRKDRRFDRVPVAVLTTSNLVEDISFCMDHGADKFISKPATSEGFAALVDDLTAMARKGRGI